MSDPNMTAHLFGNFRLLIGNRILDNFKKSKVQALLVYLLLNRDRPTLRDTLIDLLWPNMPRRSALVNLRRALYQAREMLEGAGEQPIISKRKWIQLNPNLAISLDVAAFTHLLETVYAHNHFDLSTCEDCFASLEQAVTLYQNTLLNDVYLPDSDEFEKWLYAQRQHYQRMLLDALSTLTVIYLHKHRYTQAEATASRQLAHDKFREIAQQQLMEAQARNGKYEAARTTYEQFRSRLSVEQGMSPNERTTRLAERIAAGEINLTSTPATTVRGYRLKDKLGSGAFGIVHRAIQPLIEREVAVKIIQPVYANRPNFIRRFEVEAQTIANLEHAHVVPLYDYWREPNGAFLVMRYMRGGNLADALQDGEPWGTNEFLRFLKQISSALGTAHRQGIVHRDLKPTNILLDETGNAYLSDFGIAHHVAEGSIAAAEIAKLSVSPYYAPPEQLQGGVITPQSDIYTFGYLIFELLAGHKPFATDAFAPARPQHLTRILPSLHAIRADLPPEVDQLLSVATAAEPSARIANVEEFATRLHALLDHNVAHLWPALTQRVEGNPYKGLRPFQESDAELFFGRTTLISQLLTHLESSLFLSVVGPSGSGKSSVVKAGLLPQLRNGTLAGSANWFISEMVPGAEPLQALAHALLHVAVDPPATLIEPLEKDANGLSRTLKRILPSSDLALTQLLLVIDQFEELFTLSDTAQRRQFLNNLLTALESPNPQLRVVITLRADFYDKPLQVARLAQHIQAHNVVVTPLTAVEIEQSILQPAYLAGVRFDNGLVTRIVDDVRDQPGMLPLLQYALTELFERREGHTLTHDAYDAIGGIDGVLGRRAEALYLELDDDTRVLARQMFMRLVTLGEGVEDSRRRVVQQELESLMRGQHVAQTSGQTLARILERFGTARLLSFDRDPHTRQRTIEVAHEALLREWPRLRTWLEENRADLRLQRQLSKAAAEWRQSEQDASYLLGGTRLDQFAQLAERRDVALTSAETDYLQTSLAARAEQMAIEEARQQHELTLARDLAESARRRAEEQHAAAERLRRRAVYLATSLMLVAALAVVAIFFARQRDAQRIAAESEASLRATAEAVAVAERETALQQTRLTRSRELALAATNALEEDAELSILLALSALEISDTREAEDALRQAVLSSRVRARMYGQGYPMAEITFSPDGAKLFGTSWRDFAERTTGIVFAWDVATGEELYLIDNIGHYGNRGAFTAEGDLYIVALEDSESGALLRFYRSDNGDLVRSLGILPANIRSDEARDDFFWVRPAVMSAVSHPKNSHIAASTFDLHKLTAAVFDLESGVELFALTGFGDEEALYWQDGPNYSPDGRYLAGGSALGSAAVWDANDGTLVMTVTHSADAPVVEAIFSPDGETLYTKGAAGVIKAWEMATGTLRFERDTLSSWYGIDLSADGMWLASGNQDGDGLILDANTGETVLELSGGDTNGIGDMAFSPDGTLVAGKGENGVVLVWTLETATAMSHQGSASALAYDPSGTILATAGLQGKEKIWDVLSADTAHSANTGFGTIRLWDSTNEQLIHDIAAHDDWIGGLVFSPDGSRLASSSDDHTAKVWDVESGELQVTLTGHSDWVNRIAFTPDGQRLITTGQDKTIRIWDSVTGLQHDMIAVDSPAWGVAISADGARFATAADNAAPNLTMITVWDADTNERLLTLAGTARGATNIFFTADGNQLIAYDIEGFVSVWDSHTGELNAQFDIGRRILAIDLHPDGNQLVIGTFDGTVELWELATAQRRTTLFNVSGNWQMPVFSPDGQSVTAASIQDGHIREFLLDIEALIALAESRLTRDFTEDECVQYRIDLCLKEGALKP